MSTTTQQIRPLKVSEAIALREGDIVGLRMFGDIVQARVVSDVQPKMGRTTKGQFTRWIYHVPIAYYDARLGRVVYAHVSEHVMKESLVHP